MAVKHKVIECHEQSENSQLKTILRVLESIEHQQQHDEVEIACRKIVTILGKVYTPHVDYLQFLEQIDLIQQTLAKWCTNERMIVATLLALYSEISDVKKRPSPVLSIVLGLIGVSRIPETVKKILTFRLHESYLEQAVLTLCGWLSQWTITPILGPLVLALLQGLESEQHWDILEKVGQTCLGDLIKVSIIPDHRKNVGPVVLYLISVRHSEDVLYKISTRVKTFIYRLDKEKTESSLFFLESFVSHALLQIHENPKHPLYATLNDFRPPSTSSSSSYNTPTLLLRPTSPGGGSYNNTTPGTLSLGYHSSDAIAAVTASGNKVGLNNLGNTCYMNSVLQALFMTQSFRNEILLLSGDHQPQIVTPLFSQLQTLFARLQFSGQVALSPAEILTCARPPYFQPGHQHDSSEFLGYLLDVLHEQEKALITTAGNPTTIVQRSFGGRAITQSTCGNCGGLSEHSDTFRDLQLSFPPHSLSPVTVSSSPGDNSSTTNGTGESGTTPHSSVQQLLDYYLQPERLCGENQYHCDQCGGLADGVRNTAVVVPPPRLVLTLKHFRYDPVTQLRTKLRQRVHLNTELHLGATRYRLYAAVVHCGSSLDSGHYYTYALDNTSANLQNNHITLTTKNNHNNLGKVTLTKNNNNNSQTSEKRLLEHSDDEMDFDNSIKYKPYRTETAYNRSQRLQAEETNSWYKFNDCSVQLSDARELYTLRPPEAPYVLFYSRVDCEEPPPVTVSQLCDRVRETLSRDERGRRQLGNNGGGGGVVTRARRRRDEDDEEERGGGGRYVGCGGGGGMDACNRFVC